MPAISPPSTPRVTVSVPVPEPMAKPQAQPKGQPQPQAAPQPQYGPPPWHREPEPEFQPRLFVEAHSLVFPYSTPPRQTFRPVGGMKFRRGGRPVRYNHQAFAAHIATSGPDEMSSLAYADYLAENGHSGAEEVIRRHLEHRRTMRQSDEQYARNHLDAADAWPEGWIRAEAVQAMDDSPIKSRAWGYPSHGNDNVGKYQVAFATLSHPVVTKVLSDPHRHVVQYHTGPMEPHEARRLLGTMAHEGVAGAGEGWRTLMQHHPELAQPHRPERMTRPRRYSHEAFHRGIIESPQGNLAHHLAYADYLEEGDKPHHAEIIRRAVDQAQSSEYPIRHVEAYDGSHAHVYWGDTTPPGAAMMWAYTGTPQYDAEPAASLEMIFRPASHPNGRILYSVRGLSHQDARRLAEGAANEGAVDPLKRFNPDPRRRMARPRRFARQDWPAHLAAISKKPADPVLHLAFADRLEEDGLPGVAAIIRRHVGRFQQQMADINPAEVRRARPVPNFYHHPYSRYGEQPELPANDEPFVFLPHHHSPVPYPSVSVGFNLPGRQRVAWYTAAFTPEEAYRHVSDELPGGVSVYGSWDAKEALKRLYGEDLAYKARPAYGSTHRVTSRGPASYRHEDVNAWLGRRDSRRLRDNLYARRESDGSITWTLYSTPIVTAHPDDTFTIRHGGWYTPTTARNIRRLSPGSMAQSRDGDVRVDIAGNRIDQSPERMTRKLTLREKVARRRGRLIKREVASGKHPDRKTAVLTALALSIKADEV